MIKLEFESSENFYVQYVNRVIEKPIYNVLFHPSIMWMKCFTYFSALKKYWNLFRIDSYKIHLRILDNFTEYGSFQTFGISLHSNNVLQRYTKLDYFSVKPNEGISVKYSQINIELVLGGFVIQIGRAHV